MNSFQKAVRWLFQKAVGFPSWNTTNWPRHLLVGSAGAASELSTVYGCCRVRGQTIGSVPFHVYREDPKTGKREKFLDHPLYPILHDSPNAYQTSMEWRECMERSFCLWGNAYSEIKRLGKRVVALNFLPPSRVRPVLEYGKPLIYRYTYNGITEDLQPEQVLHIKNFSDDGICGQSPLLRYVMEHALSAQSFGLNFLKNGGRPGGYLQMKGKRPANESTVEKMKQDWDAHHGGAENAGKTGVLWEESKYVPVEVPPEEAQLLETAKRLTGDIAGAIYGVPLNLLGQPAETSTYASAEQFAIDFVKHTVRPQSVRYEQAIKKALLASEPNVFCELDLDGLQRGDSQSQQSTFCGYAQNGIMTRNEVRRKLNLPEIDGGDELTVQSNLIDLDKLARITSRAAATSSAGGNL